MTLEIETSRAEVSDVIIKVERKTVVGYLCFLHDNQWDFLTSVCPTILDPRPEESKLGFAFFSQQEDAVKAAKKWVESGPKGEYKASIIKVEL